jgi:hypothetical protein
MKVLKKKSAVEKHLNGKNFRKRGKGERVI